MAKRRGVMLRIADAIVQDLFANGFGERADRIALIDSAGRGLGGWSRDAAVQRIVAVLEKQPPTPDGGQP